MLIDLNPLIESHSFKQDNLAHLVRLALPDNMAVEVASVQFTAVNVS
jgi:hypothetical protein